MPWVVGIDEAGYGPNLGPLVQAAVALYLPDHDVAGWETLKPVVRRCGEKADGRVLIDDSKHVYARGGLEALELGVLSALQLVPGSLRQFLDHAALPECQTELASECWFEAEERLPVMIDAAGLENGAGKWLETIDRLR